MLGATQIPMTVTRWLKQTGTKWQGWQGDEQPRRMEWGMPEVVCNGGGVRMGRQGNGVSCLAAWTKPMMRLDGDRQGWKPQERGWEGAKGRAPKTVGGRVMRLLELELKGTG